MTGTRVLVVEDNERNMKLVRDVLEASGYEVVAATTGRAAADLAVQHAPALVLMDARLPDMDGIAALGELRSNESTAAIPVLAVTAQAMKGDRERFIAAGFNDYLSKPLDIDELLSAVAKYVQREP